MPPRSTRSNSYAVQQAIDAQEAHDLITKRAQDNIANDKLRTAIKKQWADLANAGIVDPSVVPNLQGNFDVKSEQQRVNAADPRIKLGSNYTAGPVGNTVLGAPPVRQAPPAMPVPTATKRLDTAAAATPGVGGLALQAAGGQAQADAAAPLAGTLAAPNVNLPGRTPMEAAMDAIPFHNGMSGAGATQTGAGMVMNTTLPNGTTRQVAVNPTFEQKMHAQTGGQWGGWTKAQRADYLRSNPATGNDGTVTDPGVTPFNVRGERNVTQNTKDGAATSIEYDPRQDRVQTRTPNAAGGFDITSKYGVGSSSNAQPVPLVHPADAAAVAAAPPATMQQIADANALQTNLANPPVAAAPLAGTATPPPGAPPVVPVAGAGAPPAVAGAIAGAVAPITPSGAAQLQSAQADLAARKAAAAATDAQYDKTQADQAAAEKAKQIQQTPTGQTKQQFIEDPSRFNFPPLASNDTAPTPLGSTSMQESPLTAFATSPEDAQFKKRLVDGGDPNDGVA